jgi:hypothetical protein
MITIVHELVHAIFVPDFAKVSKPTRQLVVRAGHQSGTFLGGTDRDIYMSLSCFVPPQRGIAVPICTGCPARVPFMSRPGGAWR